MTEHNTADLHFSKELEELLNAFDTRKSLYLSPGGEWKAPPRTLEQCACHEFLYLCSTLETSRRGVCFQQIHLQLSEYLPTHVPETLEGKATTSMPLLGIIQFLTWAISARALQINSERYVPGWNRAAQDERRDYSRRLEHLQAGAEAWASAGRRERAALELFESVLSILPDEFCTIPPLLAEEDRLNILIDRILGKTQDPGLLQESYARIIQTLHPATGDVAEISPAYLRPCMRLLLDDSIPVDSGIPYTASVLLSVLHDRRSTTTILAALNKYPARYTKIRENLLYALGTMREPGAVPAAVQVLEEPDTLQSSAGAKDSWVADLMGQKVEAVQALGRIGLPSLPAIPSLLKYLHHPSETLKTHLAWTLGEIGKAQKNKVGGVSADIVITLLRLLGIKNKDSFIESVRALRTMGCPEFLHSLHLYDIGAVNILGIKPAQKGLFELSETLHYLIRTKGQAVMAVSGDSGTGKTYFCETIKEGFGDIKTEEILYLMRDRKRDQRIFNRILGRGWLEKHIDPAYYEGDPISEEGDDPESYFARFLDQAAGRKLIILDGCRDWHYFQQVIERFYLKGRLDVVLNFRSAYSTRRANLETREVALESVNSHLAFLEEPALEDTQFYQQGNVLIFDLDNSINHRLGREEIQELFQRSRVSQWGDLILLGNLGTDRPDSPIDEGTPALEKARFDYETEPMPEGISQLISVEERRFRIELSGGTSTHPYFLGQIPLNDINPEKIRFYAQEQIAGVGQEGLAFVLTFVDSRIFSAPIGSNHGLAVSGRNIFTTDDRGRLQGFSFERNQETRYPAWGPPITCLAAVSKDTLVTGHSDGSLRLWDFYQRRIWKLPGHEGALRHVLCDPFGRIYSTGSDRLLKRWDLAKKTVLITSGLGNIHHIKNYPGERILVESDALHIMDLEKNTIRSLSLPHSRKISDLSVTHDGRIVAALPDTIAVFSPNETSFRLRILEGHTQKTRGCLTMGPKLLTCGHEPDGHSDIRIYGSKFFVKQEAEKLSLTA
jgi:hypothetical protein